MNVYDEHHNLIESRPLYFGDDQIEEWKQRYERQFFISCMLGGGLFGALATDVILWLLP